MSEFDCNICFDLAQDPVITPCGHLHCWPCLYKWLKTHSSSHECPVCRALIDQEKLIPLYGRGTTIDPRSKPVPDSEIPNRPLGRRPETAPVREANELSRANAVFGRRGSNFGFSPTLSFQFHGFSRYGYGYNGLFGDHGEGGDNREIGEDHVQGNDENLKKIHFFILVFVIFAFLTL